MKNLSLDLECLEVKDVRFGEKTSLDNGVLSICKQELLNVLKDDALKSADVDLARPGESVRIIPVKDVVEPRVKVDSGKFYPGILGGFDCCGCGKTKVLKGCGVVTTGQIVHFQEGLIDMSGPAAELSPYSKLNNVVVIAEPTEGITPYQHEKAVRMAGLKAALYLAEAVKDNRPDWVENYSLDKIDNSLNLPRVGVVYFVLSQGLLHDNFIYGLPASQLHPVLLHPNEMLDGALVSANCVSACDKNTTYDHTTNPMLSYLYENHGVNLDFAGVIASPVSAVLKDKERCALGVSNLARQLGLDGVVVIEEGGGNPETDLMMICQHLEKCDIKTVLMLHENAGVDGIAQGITTVASEADAVVSSGNVNELVTLPKMEKTIGHASAMAMLAGAVAEPFLPDGRVLANLAVITGGASNMGLNCQKAATY